MCITDKWVPVEEWVSEGILEPSSLQDARSQGVKSRKQPLLGSVHTTEAKFTFTELQEIPLFFLKLLLWENVSMILFFATSYYTGNIFFRKQVAIFSSSIKAKASKR